VEETRLFSVAGCRGGLCPQPAGLVDQLDRLSLLVGRRVGGQDRDTQDQLPGRPDGQNTSERRSAGPVNCIRSSGWIR
jgi:hypothetical protein